MSHLLARDHVTVFDKQLPRVALSRSELRKHHARMLRLFARHEHFDSDRLTVRIKVKHNNRLYEFSSLNSLFEWSSNCSTREVPDTLELSYQFGKFVQQTPDRGEVLTMNASILFGECGQNECYVSSNDADWLTETHQYIRDNANRFGIHRYGKYIQNTCFAVAFVALVIFGTSFFPFASTASILTILAFFAMAGVVAWPTNYYPIKNIIANKIFLSKK